MTRPSSWFSKPFMFTVKSMMDDLALISGLYTGFGSLVVIYSWNPSITLHSLSPTLTFPHWNDRIMKRNNIYGYEVYLKWSPTDLETFSWFDEVFLKDIVESRIQLLIHIFNEEWPSHGETVFQMGAEELVVEWCRLKERSHIDWRSTHSPQKKNQNVKFAQISCKPWRTCKKLAFSFSLIQVFPWVCGSMRSGYLEALVTMMPFCTDKSSPGSPWRFHSLILNTN